MSNKLGKKENLKYSINISELENTEITNKVIGLPRVVTNIAAIATFSFCLIGTSATVKASTVHDATNNIPYYSTISTAHNFNNVYNAYLIKEPEYKLLSGYNKERVVMSTRTTVRISNGNNLKSKRREKLLNSNDIDVCEKIERKLNRKIIVKSKLVVSERCKRGLI